MSTQQTLTRDNARLYVEMAANNPIVAEMEAIWREPDTEDGAGCMAAYISQFIGRLVTMPDDYHDLLRDAVLARWETM